MTKWLWVNDRTFVIPTADGYPKFTFRLVYVTLFPNNSFSISTRCLGFLRHFVMQETSPNYFKNYLGNFFLFPHLDLSASEPSFFYFVAHCPKHYCHSRLLLVCRQSLKIVRFLDLPGVIADIALDPKTKELFLALEANKECEFNTEYLDGGDAPPLPSAYTKLKCQLNGPWLSKGGNTNLFQKNVVFKIEETGRKWETNKCFEFQTFSPPGFTDLTSNLHKTIFFRNRAAFSTSLMHLTDDYLVTHDDQIRGGREISRRHHYHCNIGEVNKFFRFLKIFRHPTLPIMCSIGTTSSGFNVYLDEWAESEMRHLFPRLDGANKVYHFKSGHVEFTCSDD